MGLEIEFSERVGLGRITERDVVICLVEGVVVT
jgi:hypothetical protein